MHEAIVDAVFIGKDDTTIRGPVPASGSFDYAYGGSAADDTTFADGESTIKTLEQNNRLSSSSKRGARGSGEVDDPTAVATTVTESTAPIKNTRTNQQNAMPSLDEDSDGSYELV